MILCQDCNLNLVAYKCNTCRTLICGPCFNIHKCREKKLSEKKIKEALKQELKEEIGFLISRTQARYKLSKAKAKSLINSLIKETQAKS